MKMIDFNGKVMPVVLKDLSFVLTRLKASGPFM